MYIPTIVIAYSEAKSARFLVLHWYCACHGDLQVVVIVVISRARPVWNCERAMAI